MHKRVKRIVKAGIAAGLLIGAVVLVRYFMPLQLPSYEHNWPDAPWEYAVTVLKGTNAFGTVQNIDPHAPPLLSARDVTDMPASFVADPFLFQTNGLWYLFVEVLNAASGHGDLCVATSKNGSKWAYQGVVLDEPEHLSYPRVFSWQGRMYMVPEYYRSGAVRLYTTDTFPFGWRYVTDLVKGQFVDNTPFRYDGRWWMFCGVRHNADLHLFWSDSLESGWREHPKSPVVWGNANIARPGGSTFVDDTGRLVRITQDCDPYYGNSVRAFEITTLTTNDYREVELAPSPLLNSNVFDWASSGMHQFDPVRANTSNELWLASVDGFAPASPDVPLDVHYANGMMLGGVSIWPTHPHPGGHLLMRFFWKGIPEGGLMDSPCSAFVHIRKASRIVFQGDYTLMAGRDFYEHAVPIPADLAPGTYTVRVGLYNPLNGRRVRMLKPRINKRGEFELPLTITIGAADGE